MWTVQGNRRASKGKRERATSFWSKARVKELEEAIVTFGSDHFADIREYVSSLQYALAS